MRNDYQAQAAPRSVAPRAIPAPPPSHRPQHNPVFYRQAPVSEAYPPAPNSLAPVEMYRQQHNTDRHLGMANTSSVQVRPPPSWRTGVMILLAGVFVGGTFGIGVQARRNAEAAQAEAAAAAVAPQATQAAAPVLPSAQQTQPAPPPSAYAQAPAVAPRPTNLPPGAIVIPPQQGVVVVPPSQPQPQVAPQAPMAMAPTPQLAPQQPQAAPAPPPAKRPAYAWRAPSRPTGMIAAKVPQQPKAEKQAAVAPPPPADPPEKPAKAEKPAKGGKGGTSAQDVLQAAIGETTNTL